ncbi:TraB/GumN family protein [Mameliella sediminis]|uniref:TraB/GumN family protein n=1 Tax=Mameliella sediminis TaxID=2836866 RepID=UPI001C47728E|nr:TraB/GumN family protein [Mameliella sediminis]MBV7396004.1 TraB/GumN family protein [Mameliella sediminis]
MRGMIRGVLCGGLACLALLADAPRAEAQAWATRALCFPPRIEIHDTVFAPEGRDELERRAAEIPNGTGRFWRIESPAGAVSHLWGTMHSSHRSVLTLPAPVTTAIEGASHVALEIDPTFPDRASHDAYMRGDDVYRPDARVTAYADLDLPPRIEPHLVTRLGALGWPRDALGELKLGTLAELLLYDPCEDFSAGVLPSQDSYIQTLAHIHGIPVLPLEDSARLSAKLNTPGNEDLARAIIGTYAIYLMPGGTPEARATALALYGSGQVGLMMAWDHAQVTASLGNEGPALYARMTDYLVDERNVDFVKAARDALTEGGVFAAVGNFHLPGENGMIELLRAEGFTVTRVPLPGEAL